VPSPGRPAPVHEYLRGRDYYQDRDAPAAPALVSGPGISGSKGDSQVWPPSSKRVLEALRPSPTGGRPARWAPWSRAALPDAEAEPVHQGGREASHPHARATPSPPAHRRGLDGAAGERRAQRPSFDERFALLVDAEWRTRENKRLTRALQEAKFKLPHACVEAIDFPARRELDKALIRQLATCRWLEEHQQVLINGMSFQTVGPGFQQRWGADGYLVRFWP
jgi:IstB-like ATP binding protein